MVEYKDKTCGFVLDVPASEQPVVQLKTSSCHDESAKNQPGEMALVALLTTATVAVEEGSTDVIEAVRQRERSV